MVYIINRRLQYIYESCKVLEHMLITYLIVVVDKNTHNDLNSSKASK